MLFRMYHTFAHRPDVRRLVYRVPPNTVRFTNVLALVEPVTQAAFFVQTVRVFNRTSRRMQQCVRSLLPHARFAYALLAPALLAYVPIALMLSACSGRAPAPALANFVTNPSTGERVRVLELHPGVTATIVAPAQLNTNKRVDLILYALPNGNSTAQTIGRKMADGVDWHFDIQHIGAQTRALRTLGLDQAIVVYLEADTKSWPEWRRINDYDKANKRIVEIVDELRATIGNPSQLAVTLTGHSGGGSFAWGFIDGQDSLPPWLVRIGYLDSNYSFESRHGDKLVRWLRGDSARTLVVLAYDDREIMLDGKKVVTDSGGTWRASQRMIDNLQAAFPFVRDTLGDFIRYRNAQMEFVLHPNPANRILHTEMIGEMNGYMHAMLVRIGGYTRENSVLRPARAYTRWVEPEVTMPVGAPPAIPTRAGSALTGSAFMASVAGLSNTDRELAIRRELLAGNIPSFLRVLRTVEVPAKGADGVTHAVSYEVMPDYLSIGSDSDYVRIPMTPYTAQAFCDAFGFVLPTRKMVNDIWKAARTHVEPRPLTELRESPLTFMQHDRIIQGQLKGARHDAFVAGIKKDVVVSNLIAARPDRVVIYGWHYLSGEPIQPMYSGHLNWYVDYSHGVRPVRRMMQVDGVRQSFEKILTDSVRLVLLSDEGAIKVPRYPVPE